MGTWISHLRIAENLLSVMPGLVEEAFTFGNLAPDSGVPNADWTVFDPPKEVTHFLLPNEDEGRIKDLEFYRLYLAGLVPDHNAARYSFVLGYFFHLLCDNLWFHLIVRSSKSAFPALFARRGREAWSDLKDDWYGQDQCYVRDHPESLFWRVLMRAPNPPAYLPFVPEAALNQQLDYIRKFYSQPDSAWVLDRAYPYLNEAMMRRYVSDSTQAVLAIHDRLRNDPAPAGAHTALALLSKQAISPYDLPLGDAVEA
jgi:hypothetical protein